MLKWWTVLTLCSLLASHTKCQGDFFKTENKPHPGPWVKPTLGQVWPKPRLMKSQGEVFFTLKPSTFNFEYSSTAASCDLVVKAALRYRQTWLFPFGDLDNIDDNEIDEDNDNNPIKEKQLRGELNTLKLSLDSAKGCEQYPHADMIEQYELKIGVEEKPSSAELVALSVWGMIRGLETLSQLVHVRGLNGRNVYALRANTRVWDAPRFRHRGLLLDSSRHFLSVAVLKDNLELMAMNKMNVFHWHLTDDPAFPFQSAIYPELSSKGAFSKHHVYSRQQVKEVVEFARQRGIRVLAEFDTPGHTQSWELGRPGLLTRCFNTNGHYNGLKGPLNVINETLYKFLESFFEDALQLFPDKYVHLGGDEVDTSCWRSNPDVRKYVKENFGGNFRRLESKYIERLLGMVGNVSSLNKRYIVWQEVFDNGDKIRPDTIVQVWKGSHEQELRQITRAGYKAILSSPWYLNYINYGSDWIKYYKVEPGDFANELNQKQLLVGGEACIWGEFVTSINLLPRLWPRASAVAERLWSTRETRDVDEAAKRLAEHECRMLHRGFPVETANGPGFCPIYK